MADDETPPQTWLDDPGPVRGTARPVGGRANRETPAEPIGDVGRCSDQCPTLFGITGPLCALRYGHLGSHESDGGTIWSFMPGVDSEPAAQPDAAPAPDGAGGAGDEVYFAAARAMLATDSRPEFALYEWHSCSRPSCKTPCACSGQPYPSAVVRAAIDVSRASLLVKVAGLEEELEQSDSELVEASIDRDACAEDAAKARADLAEAIRERDEARAKTDGGQASLMTAVAGMHRRIATQHEQVTELVEQHMAEIARELERIDRVFPVEPVTDDGGAT